MTTTKTRCDAVESTTTDEDVTITVPERVVDAIADRLETLEDPDEDVAHDLALDHVDMSHRLVTEGGEDVATAALDRAGVIEEDVDIPLDEETIEAVDKAAEARGMSREEWVCAAARDRLNEVDDTDDVTLEYDEDEAGHAGSEDPEPIEVDAIAKLDYATDPEQPLSIELEVPAGVIDEDELGDVLDAVSINARIADE